MRYYILKRLLVTKERKILPIYKDYRKNGTCSALASDFVDDCLSQWLDYVPEGFKYMIRETTS